MLYIILTYKEKLKMGIGRDPRGQFHINIIEDVIKAFGDVPAALGTLIDLGDNYTYTHFFVINSLNSDTIIKFGTKEITFPSGKDIWLDDFKHNNVIQYKYKSSAPTSGSLQVISY